MTPAEFEALCEMLREAYAEVEAELAARADCAAADEYRSPDQQGAVHRAEADMDEAEARLEPLDLE